MQFGIGTKPSCWCIGNCAHAAERSDEEKFHPERDLHVVRDCAVDSRVTKHVVNGDDALTSAIVQLADDYRGRKAGVTNVTRRNQKANNLAESANYSIVS